jgi:hypothetical protein
MVSPLAFLICLMLLPTAFRNSSLLRSFFIPQVYRVGLRKYIAKGLSLAS